MEAAALHPPLRSDPVSLVAHALNQSALGTVPNRQLLDSNLPAPLAPGPRRVYVTLMIETFTSMGERNVWAPRGIGLGMPLLAVRSNIVLHAG